MNRYSSRTTSNVLCPVDVCAVCKLPLSIADDIVCEFCEARTRHHMENHSPWTVQNTGQEITKRGHFTVSID